MNFFLSVVIFFFITNCSFDNKTGIWKNNDNIQETKKRSKVSKSESLSRNDGFNKIIKNDKFKFILSPPVENLNWSETFYNNNNNFDHFKFSGLNEISYKSSRISKYKLSTKFLIVANKLISTDQKGNLIIYSIKQKTRSKFNFYKKKYKKLQKELNIISQDDFIYVSDNLGYLYSYNYKKNKLEWAKYYEVPFRSNLKLIDNKLLASDQNNNIYFFDKFSGKILKQIPTEENIIKNNFKNSFSINNKNILFLNNYGSLYSIDNTSLKINWFLNLNQSLNPVSTNLFSGTQVVSEGNKIFISSNENTYIIDDITGNILFKKNFSSKIKPIIHNNYYFCITKNNYLLAMNIKNGEIIYSLRLKDEVNKKFSFQDTKLKNIFIVNNKLFVLFKNSNILEFDISGNLLNLIELPSEIKSNLIFINKKIYYLNKKKKLVIIR